MRNEITIERPDLAVDMILPVAADQEIIAGQLVGCDPNGNAIGSFAWADYSPFMGIAQENVDATGKSNGELTVKIKYPKILKSPNATGEGSVSGNMIGLYAYSYEPFGVYVNNLYTDASTEVMKTKYIGKVVGIDTEKNMVIIRTGL